MTEAFNLIKQSELLLVEMSTKEVGVGIEMGFAKSLGIPIIGVRKRGVESSTTMEGTLTLPVAEYETTLELSRLIKQLLIDLSAL